MTYGARVTDTGDEYMDDPAGDRDYPTEDQVNDWNIHNDHVDGDDEGYWGGHDVEADADTLASAGWGTDEDYGYFGDDEW